MNIDNHALKDKDTEEIVSVLIDHVSKSDEEVQREREEGSRTTELKVFVAENKGFELGTLSQEIQKLAESEDTTKHVDSFITEHNFVEERLNKKVSYVEIHTPNYERTDQFVFLDNADYLKVLTAERRDWTKKTVENLLRYVPDLDRLFLSSEDLRDIVTGLPKTTISGFTAKYHSYHTDKRVTIQFHGGTESDLQKVEEVFGARPTRLEFDQANSPTKAIHSSVDRQGYFKLTRVRRGSEQKGVETLQQIFHDYEEHDREHFEVEFTPRRIPLKSGFTIEGFTTLQLIEKEEDGDDKTPSEKLKGEILERKRRYDYTVWEPGNYLVFDKEHNEPFEIGIEDRDLVVYAKPATTSVTLRDFCNLILEEFNSTYGVEKTSNLLRA
ncbi:hypothetical protein BRC72_10685 [Halobacteriales archaeon QH_7_66_36]|nr:MAG: hypothetical protein BRC72_10685 [Halobacteriales archaeon QH_7_66_36]